MNIIRNFCLQHELKKRIAESRNRLFRMAFSWCHDSHLAEDLAQDTLTKALKNMNQLQNPKAFDGWLFCILTNCWRDHLRRRQEMTDIDNIELPDTNTPERYQQRQDLVDNVRHHVSCLPQAQRQVVTLIDLEGFSYTQVAEILEIPVGTVMSRLSRARQQLASTLLDFKVSLDGERRSNLIRRIK